MSRRELAAAGIHDAALRGAYETCRRLNARHGRTYYLATKLLPVAKRPHVHALYGFARFADELVDSAPPDAGALERWGRRFLDALADGRGPDDLDRSHDGYADAVLRAAVHTGRTWRIESESFATFLDSMRSDVTVTGYPTYADLERYMAGSAAAIGVQMLPILEPLDPSAAGYAETLGEAFQMTNFIRDIADDHELGRVYLPGEDLEKFGVCPDDLRRGPTPTRVRDLVSFEVERTRRLYAAAEPGIDLLHPSSRPCVRTAFTLYGGILDEIERSGYRVLDRRVAVSLPRRLAVALPAWLASRRRP